MLRLRICPHCQEEVYSPQAYFCHRCGAELPPSPEVEDETKSVETPRRGVSTVPKSKNRKLMVVVATPARLASRLVASGLVVALLAAAGAGIYYSQTKPSLPSLPSPPSSPTSEALVANLSFAVPNHPFSAKGLSEIVPADVDLYLESVDPEILLPSLVPADDWSETEEFFNEHIGLTPTEAASFLEDEFAIIQEATASAFLSRVRDADFVEQKIADVGEYEGWQAKLVNGFLVVSNSPELIAKIGEAQKKLTLNLSLTSGFTEVRQKLPSTGQVFIYGKKRPVFIPESLKGEAFVMTKRDSGALITGVD